MSKMIYPTTLKEKMVLLELLNVWTEPTFQSVLQKKAQLLTSIERDPTVFNDKAFVERTWHLRIYLLAFQAAAMM